RGGRRPPRRLRALGPDAAEDEVAGEEPRMEAPVAASHVVEVHVVEAGEELAYGSRREHPEMRRVVLRRPSGEEAEPALHAEGVRHRADEHAPRAKDAADLDDERVRELEVLEE